MPREKKRKALASWGNAGFTLVEIIVVLVILAILAAMLIPSLTGYIDKADSKACAVNRSQVMRYYMASAAFQSYQVSNVIPLLEEALAECGGTRISASSYQASCGGICTITYSEDKARILSIYCNLHGGGYTAPNVPFAIALKDLNLNLPTAIDSTAPDENEAGDSFKKQILDYFAANGIYSLDELNISSWAISAKDASKDYPNMWFSDQDITACNVGDQVRVIKYNSKSGTYTAGYSTIVEKTMVTANKETVTYNTFGSYQAGADWKEYSSEELGKQTDATKKSYEETMKYYYEMTPAVSK